MSVVYDFSGRTAIVTGGSAGIGLSACRRLIAGGAHVVVLDPNSPGPDAAGLSGHLDWIACDIADEGEVTGAMDRIADSGATVSLLVNNAGASVHAEPEGYALTNWERVLRVNMTGTFLLSREVVRRRGPGPVSIVNLSSIAGTTALGRGIFAYGAAKAGIDQLTRDLAVEWASLHVRVNAVAPCQVETPGYARVTTRVSGEDIRATALRGIPMGRFATVDEVSAVIAFLLSEDAAMVTGVVVPVDGGNLALNAGGSLRPSIS